MRSVFLRDEKQTLPTLVPFGLWWKRKNSLPPAQSVIVIASAAQTAKETARIPIHGRVLARFFLMSPQLIVQTPDRTP